MNQIGSYDTIGDIAILKFPESTKHSEKQSLAKTLLKERLNIKTVLEKSDKIKGRLRTYKVKFLAGARKTITIHKESGCVFKLDVSTCYFSPRLSNERLEIANSIKKKHSVLVLFAGVSPYSIVIAKIAKPKKVVSIELGRDCCKYGQENVKINKLNNVKIIQGDVKRLIPKLKEKFDVIVMPRPQLPETFLKQALLVSKKGTLIFFRVFGKQEDLENIMLNIRKEAKTCKKTLKLLKINKAGEISPYKFRWRFDFKVL